MAGGGAPAPVTDVPGLRAALLAWYDAQARALPWRTPPDEGRRGTRPDPYRVWLSEVMLQQTTVPHATPYFLAFLQRWPTAHSLAAAEDADVMAAWAGLGYYARARNLLACARAVAGEHGGRFPTTEAGLLALPGVGAYTAAAVAAIAFDEACNVVDGNVERVMARLFAVQTPLPQTKPELKRLAETLVRAERPGDWAQALMDLGAVICRPKAPLCERCPVRPFCAAYAGGTPESFPRRSPRAERPHRYGAAFVLTCRDHVALVQRPPKGLLGGMLGLPTTDWVSTQPPGAPPTAAPLVADWRPAGEVGHIFTHFSLTLQVWRAETPTQAEGDALLWTDIERAAAALPSVFLKALRAGLPSPP